MTPTAIELVRAIPWERLQGHKIEYLQDCLVKLLHEEDEHVRWMLTRQLIDCIAHAGSMFESTVVTVELLVALLQLSTIPNKKWILETLSHITFDRDFRDHLLMDEYRTRAAIIYRHLFPLFDTFVSYAKSADRDIRFFSIGLVSRFVFDTAQVNEALFLLLEEENHHINRFSLIQGIYGQCLRGSPLTPQQVQSTQQKLQAFLADKDICIRCTAILILLILPHPHLQPELIDQLVHEFAQIEPETRDHHHGIIAVKIEVGRLARSLGYSDGYQLLDRLAQTAGSPFLRAEFAHEIRMLAKKSPDDPK